MNVKTKKANRKSYISTIGLFAAWAIPCGIMLFLFVINEIFPFGDRSFLFSDMYHQYMPFFSEFTEKVRAGESLYYSWKVGAGSNFYALYVYYLSSPLNWLAFLVPDTYLMEFMSYLVVFRIGMCGLTFCIYLRRHFSTDSFSTVLFACFYALSGYMAAYNWNIMWLDCVVLLPVILLGLEKLVKEGKGILYCLTLSLCIITNYYISIMVCIFLVMYFVTLLVQSEKFFKPVLQFAGYSLLAGGIAAVVLWPMVCAMLGTDFASSDFPTKLESYFSVLDELARHLICVKPEHGLAHWPNIYCGSAVLILIPLFTINSAIPLKRRFSMLALAGILLISFSTNILNFIWHGFNYPNSLPARQSFIYIWLVLIMAYEAFAHIKEIEKKQILYCFLAGVIFLLFCEKFVDSDAFSVWVEMLTLLFLMLSTILLYYYKNNESREWRLALGGLALVVVMLETGINTYNTSVGTVSRSEYLEDTADYQALYEYATGQTQGFFRVEKFTRTTKNDGCLTGYPTASVFSSTMNSRVGKLYEKLGMRHSKVFYAYDGATGLTGAMMNVQYMFGETTDTFQNEVCLTQEKLFSAVIESGDITLYKCNYSLPFGYVVPKEFCLPQVKNEDAIKLQNQMVKDLGIKDYLFTKEKTVTKEKKAQITIKRDGYYYGLVTTAGTARVEASSDYGTKEFKDLKKNSLMFLGYFKKGQVVYLENGDEEDESKEISLTIYRMDTEVLGRTLGLLSKQHMTDVVYDSAHITGRISMTEAGKVMLSVPYEKGWSIRVNGEITEPELFGDCFMMFPLEPGEYVVEMEYKTEGLKEGILLSLLCISIFVGIVFFSYNRKKEKSEKI